MNGTLLYCLWIVFQIIIGYNLLQPLLLYLVYRLRRVFVYDKTAPQISAESDYAIIVTAFQQTALLKSVIDSILNLDYANYQVYVVADDCDISNLHFEDSRIIILRPEKVIASNTGSHFYAINNFIRDHERVTIVDSDNILDKRYLKEMDKAFNKGSKAVQGIRLAKNLDTTYACLDAARDIYYHFYDCKLLYGAGSSATLSGSGMAFDTNLYKICLQSLEISGAGFDKVLQHALVRRGHRIAYSSNAILYDEKTSQSGQLVRQRARWINTWFKYFSFGFDLIWIGIKNFNFNQFLFGTVLLRPPLFIFLILSVILMVINLVIDPKTAVAWALALTVFVAGFALALKSSNPPSKVYKALLGIPKFMFFQIVSLLKVRSANKISVATEHYHISRKDEITK